jgi:hypothetical protein
MQEISGKNSYINVRNGAGLAASRTNYSGTVGSLMSANVSDSVGLTSWSRPSAGASTLYKNGAPIATNTLATEALDSTPVYIMRGSSGNYSARQLAFAAFGAGLADTEMLALYNAVQAYLTVLGAQK